MKSSPKRICSEEIATKGTQLDTLKADIKLWERQFSQENGRPPTKDDLKTAPYMYAKYRMYQKLKEDAKKIERQKEKHLIQVHKDKVEAENLKTSENISENTSENTSRNTSEYGPQLSIKNVSVPGTRYIAPNRSNSASRPTTPKSTRVIDILGPTPQMNGRALSLFEMQTPKGFETPTKKKVTPAETPTKTGIKPIEFMTPTKITTPLKVLTTPASPHTPLYLSGTTFKESDSPLAPRKIARGLSSMIAELQEMSDVGEYELDEEDINGDDGIGNENDDEPQQLFKKKGQKRTAKRVISMLKEIVYSIN